ncbi:hypothetical protein [Microscilla marina]|uniref:STAS/SEC14 domain-containing protein n=1 Tax=Microscilla marina ATCC 23134 TaxID=313606 RepID=A1ZZJ0_MICM2|nr:hypothetical protein [Microscilla marina]EAY24185.1 hypothetical protein M23134_01773 [Microscilla marina ATCC 23134]
MQMIELFNNRFQKFYYDSNRSFFINVWKPDSQLLGERSYKKEQMILWNTIRKVRPRFVVSDSTDFLYAIDPVEQDWVASEIDRLIADVHLERLAIVLSLDFLALLTIKQTIEEGRFKNITRFFDNTKDAEEWLFHGSQAA